MSVRPGLPHDAHLHQSFDDGIRRAETGCALYSRGRRPYGPHEGCGEASYAGPLPAVSSPLYGYELFSASSACLFQHARPHMAAGRNPNDRYIKLATFVEARRMLNGAGVGGRLNPRSAPLRQALSG